MSTPSEEFVTTKAYPDVTSVVCRSARRDGSGDRILKKKYSECLSRPAGEAGWFVRGFTWGHK